MCAGSRVQCLQLQVDFARFVLHNLLCNMCSANVALHTYVCKIHIAKQLWTDSFTHWVGQIQQVFAFRAVSSIYHLCFAHSDLHIYFVTLGFAMFNITQLRVTKLVFQIRCCSKLLCEHRLTGAVYTLMFERTIFERLFASWALHVWSTRSAFIFNYTT